MAFISDGTTITSFAEFEDVLNMDQRLFEANEGLTDDTVNAFLERSTQRILSLLRETDWWKDMYINKTTNPLYNTRADVPALDPNRILTRQADFTELCSMYALWNYILPKIADFSREDNAERAKIGFYQGKYQFLFDELVSAGDWYDLNNDGNIVSAEKLPGSDVLKRVR
jgi:hypothetical protein